MSYEKLDQRAKDALLRIALYELVNGGPGDGDFWDRKIQKLLAAGAKLRPDEEVTHDLMRHETR